MKKIIILIIFFFYTAGELPNVNCINDASAGDDFLTQQIKDARIILLGTILKKEEVAVFDAGGISKQTIFYISIEKVLKGSPQIAELTFLDNRPVVAKNLKIKTVTAYGVDEVAYVKKEDINLADRRIWFLSGIPRIRACVQTNFEEDVTNALQRYEEFKLKQK